jgi:membrane complex biogenesis BtpA family protein
MVHLGPLPGSPRYEGDLDAVIADALTDAGRLREAGFDALMIENFGDAPFFADDVPKVTIAAMARAIAAVADDIDLPVGVNVLRNDALGAIAVAAVTGAAFVRINVLSGLMYTDQGPVVGKAAEVLRARADLAPDTAIMADVFVKHATPPPGLTITQAVADVVERGLADAVIVSGDATGQAPDFAVLQMVRAAAGEKIPLLVGSGATESNAAELLAHADGVIAGTSLKVGGLATRPVDQDRATRFVSAARSALR